MMTSIPSLSPDPILSAAGSTPLTSFTPLPKRKTFIRRSHLLLNAYPLWQIQAGLVRSYTLLDDGSIATLGLWGSGDLVGSLFSSNETYTVECLTYVEAIPVPASELVGFTNTLQSQFRQLHDFMEILHARPVELALIRLLNWLSQKFGQPVAEGQMITIPLTHQLLGDAMGVSRVTITRLLKQFEKEEIIQRLPQRLILLQNPQPTWHYQI
uniref:Putative transcriptional regulator, Crp/Fnr family n=1 Tax=Cyanothece sp. (strain PCC 7425 / ATCC 29141) TaxID=395961 RepID=B8HKY0_CYAP4